MRKPIILLFTLCLIIGLTTVIQAKAMQADKHLIELLTSATVLNPDTGLYDVQELVKVSNIDTAGHSGLIISFRAVGPQDSRPDWNKISLQYQLHWGTESTDWSQWISFAQLPWNVDLTNSGGSASIQSNSNQNTAIMFIRFRVPQAIYVKSGFHHGHLLVEYL